MARVFATASTQYLTVASASVTTHPICISVRFTVAATGVNNALFTIDDGTNNNIFFMYMTTTNALRFSATAGGGTTNLSGGSLTTGTLYHGFAVARSATDRQLWLDGTSLGTSATSRDPTGFNRMRIGWIPVGPSYGNGNISEVALWNMSDPSAGEITALWKGADPRTIRPASLLNYWPILGNNDPEPDWVGGAAMSLVNGPTKIEHPRVVRRARPLITTKAAAAAGDAVPVCWAQYRARRVA